MKRINIIYIALASLAFTSCSDVNNMDSEGYQITGNQVDQANAAVASRIGAGVAGMYSYMNTIPVVFPNTTPYRDDDGGYPLVCLSQDVNGPDMFCANNGFNYFSLSGDYTDRNNTYANPRMRYAVFYNQLALANAVIKSIDVKTTDATLKTYLGQALAVRAFDYLCLAPYYQFNYATSGDKLCVPLITEATTDFSNNSRATVKAIYQQIMSDLNSAIELLDGYNRGSDKSRIDQQVAYGIRARANLYMENWAAAANDADKALVDYTPASRAEVSAPSFAVVAHNWIWALPATTTTVSKDKYATVDAHLSSFSSDGYCAFGDDYKDINVLLYNKIPSTDIRKSWWVDANLHSDALTGLTWEDATGDAIASLKIENVKEPFHPYTNVKFGLKTGIATDINDSDWPIMRAEEMIFIKAEGLAMSNSASVADAKTILENFVKTYRDPSYTCSASTSEALQNEIWYQRRVELWGEGFSMSDIMRLHKPVVRYHSGVDSNCPADFKFNISPDNGWLLLRFPLQEVNSNRGIVNNADGTVPSPDDNPSLTDGVTN